MKCAYSQRTHVDGIWILSDNHIWKKNLRKNTCPVTVVLCEKKNFEFQDSKIFLKGECLVFRRIFIVMMLTRMPMLIVKICVCYVLCQYIRSRGRHEAFDFTA